MPCSVLTRLLPSSIQRAEDLVGIEMPIRPLSSACACEVRAKKPIAATARSDFKSFTCYLPSGLWVFDRVWLTEFEAPGGSGGSWLIDTAARLAHSLG